MKKQKECKRFFPTTHKSQSPSTKFSEPKWYDRTNAVVQKFRRSGKKVSPQWYGRSTAVKGQTIFRCALPTERQHVQTCRLSALTIEAISPIVVMRAGTSGRRNSLSINPIELSIAFTPAGLPSTKRSLKSSVN